jgi:hypothetical protein
VGILSVKMDTVQGSVKELKTDVKEVAKKVDRLLYIIIGGLILTGGFDLFRDERNWNRSHKAIGLNGKLCDYFVWLLIYQRNCAHANLMNGIVD